MSWNKKFDLWFTLDELFSLIPSANRPQPHSSETPATWFTDLLSSYGLAYSTDALDSFPTATIKSYINAVMTNVYNRHYKDYMISVIIEEGDSEQPTNDDLTQCLIKLLNVIDNTIPKYIPLFQVYKTASSGILEPPKATSSSVSRFNDTPQDSGLFDEDSHTTNISEAESESSADIGTRVSRLDEAYRNYHSIILKWSNEFNLLFFKEEQL